MDIGIKLRWLSLFAMASVVMIHSITTLTCKHPAAWNVFVQHLFLRSFTYWAVPFFFACSGFWFAKGSFVLGQQGIGSFWAKKAKTLLVPYVLWIIVAVILVTPLVVSNNLVTGRGVWERTIVAVPGVWPKVCKLLALTSMEPIVNGPLWYVRALLLLFLLAPIWRFAARVRGGWIALVGIWLAETLFCPWSIEILRLPAMGIGWFALGMAVAVRGWEKVRLPGTVVATAGGVWAIAALVKCFHAVGMEWASSFAATKIIALIPYGGIPFLWGLYDRLGLQSRPLPGVFRETFWVYCSHQIFGSWFIAAMLYAFGKTDVVMLVVSLAGVVFMLGTSFGSAVIARRTFPRACNWLTGGRGA